MLFKKINLRKKTAMYKGTTINNSNNFKVITSKQNCKKWVKIDGPICPSSILKYIQLSSVQFSRQSSLTLRPHESQYARPPCPSPASGVYSNSCPSSWWCHPTISSSVIPFSSCPQSLPASRHFPVSQLFAWGGQSIGVSASASVLPMNT